MGHNFLEAATLSLRTRNGKFLNRERALDVVSAAGFTVLTHTKLCYGDLKSVQQDQSSCSVFTLADFLSSVHTTLHSPKTAPVAG